MRKITVLFAVLVVSFCTILNAQWQADVRLTNYAGFSSTSYNNAWCIAANGNFVHAVWADGRDGNLEIYYKRSSDAGVNWGADTRLTNNFYNSQTPALSVFGQVIHVVWIDSMGGNFEIYYKRSTDGGTSWSSDTRLTNSTGLSGYPSISVSGSFVHVVWRDDRDGNQEIYYSHSTDGGISWGTDTRLTNNTAYSRFPSVTVSGLIVHVVWEDNRDGGWGEIYYKRSIDGGISWGTDTRLTNNVADSQSPSIAFSGSIVHVLWYDSRDGNAQIYYKRSIDGGINWGTDTRLTNTTTSSGSPSVSVSGQNVHVTWRDSRDGNGEIYYKRSTDAGVIWGTDTRLTSYNASSFNSSVAVSGTAVHVVWSDFRDSPVGEIYYKRDPTGNIVGVTQISMEIPEEYSLSQNYPNPFNPVTKIRFDVPPEWNGRDRSLQIIVYDMLGREVAVLVNEHLKPGTYEVDWNAGSFPSGVYFYTLKTEKFTDSRKMILLK